MNKENGRKRWRILEVATDEFQRKMDEAVHQFDATTNGVSLYSRLAVVHQVAKQYALAEAKREGVAEPVVEIEELTDPPLSDEPTDDTPVVISFSYLT